MVPCSLVPPPQQAMDCEDDGVCFWGVQLLNRLFRNPQRPLGDRDAEDAEATVKRVVLSDPQLRLQMVELLDTHAASNRTGTFLVPHSLRHHLAFLCNVVPSRQVARARWSPWPS